MELKILTNTTEGWDRTNGTSGINEIRATYAELVELFGEPQDGDKEKVDAEWIIDIDGQIITIYNWKDGPAYLGALHCKKHNISLDTINSWSIGGRSDKAYDKLVEYFKKYGTWDE